MRSYEEIREDFITLAHMSCKPTLVKPRANDVIDEEKSVRWNREEVERRILAYEDEVKRLNSEKNARRDALLKEVYETIKRDIKGISLNDAKKIWEYVYATKNDYYDMFAALGGMVELIDSIVNKKNDARKK